MTFVSYAQNFEDVVLWRALHHIADGKYLDIGAQEPEFDSVSFAFYKAGWRGIHVDAAPTYAAKLREARPDETVIEAAVTDLPGPITFYELGGLSSGRADIAERHVEDGHQPKKILVPTVRLDHLLDLNEGDLHWMKVDVEGMEAEVLRSWGNNPKRPWVLLVESTFPNSQETTEHLWIDQVLDRGYKEALFDGLSRYFVHESRPELAERLSRPANVFDDFQITFQHFAARKAREEAENQANAAQTRISALSLDVLQLQDKVHASDQEARRSIDMVKDLRDQLRSADTDLAVERAKLAERDALAAQQDAERDALMAQRDGAQEARRTLNAELLRISRLTGTDPDEFAEISGPDQWIPAGTAYAAVKSRLALGDLELQTAREFAIQQFQAGQQSRESEVGLLGERISALQNEIAQARNRLERSEGEAAQERARLQSMIEEQTSAVHALKSDAAHLEQQLSQANHLLASVYSTRRGRFASWLGLVPNRSFERSALPPPEVAPPPAAQVSQQRELVSSVAPKNGTDISVNDIRHTSNLLAMNGGAFVDALYRTFLKRSADRAGREHYISRLQAGDSKEKLLIAIASSAEARNVGAQVEGLTEVRRAQARAKRWSFLNPGGRSLDARLNRLEYGIGEAQNSLTDRLDRMESSLDQIQAKLDGGARAPAREAGVYVQGVPVSIKRGIAIRPTNGAGEFIEQLREGVQSSMEAVSLRNGR